MVKPIGVTTKKKTNIITIGANIDPNNIPNLNQSRFNGVKNFEFIIPSNKKIIDIMTDQNLICPSFINGHRAKSKNIKKNTKPKLRFELICIVDLFNIAINLINILYKFYNIIFDHSEQEFFTFKKYKFLKNHVK